MFSQKKTVVIIVGPTAVGKTSVAIEVAKTFGTEIISADSRQCYKELSIGVARPSQEELAAVKHHFIASHSIHEKITAADFERFALDKIEELLRKHHVVVMTGGTGLYIKAFCEGLDVIPEVPAEIHEEVMRDYQNHGLEWLQEVVKRIDPGFYTKGEIKNPQRLMRAIEVFRATGHSIMSFRKGQKQHRDFSIVKFGLELSKEELHRNINSRVERMMEIGLLEEARSMIPFQHLNALQTVGYKELFGYFNAQSTLSEAIELIKRNTRQYAKRQMTWFRKDPEIEWMAPEAGEVVEKLEELGKK